MRIKSFAFILALLLCALCLILSSCANTQDNKNNSENTQEQNTNTETGNTDPITDMYFSYDEKILIKSYNSYTSGVKSLKSVDMLRNDFITYDQLSSLGGFHSFSFLYGFVEELEYQKQYQYSLYVSSNNIIEVHILHDSAFCDTTPKNEILFADLVNCNDMRKLNTDLDDNYVYEGIIKYSYHKGELSSISWNIGDISFSLYSDNWEIPIYNPISKLLNLDTAKEGLDEIIQLIKG